MKRPFSRLGNRLKRVIINPNFWLIVAMLDIGAWLHYTTQVRYLELGPLSELHFLRHAMERVLFVLPIAYAAFSFGMVGGLFTMLISLLIMLPRVFLISPLAGDALAETAAVMLVGTLMSWMVERQEREKRLRQKAVARLEATSAISAIVSQSLDLEQIITGALDKVLEVTGLEVGLVFILNEETQELDLLAYQGVSEEFAEGVDKLQIGEGFSGRVAQSGEVLVVEDSSTDPRLTREAVKKEGLQAQLLVPLKSKGKVEGVLAVAKREPRQFLPEEIDIVRAIGSQIGVAVENARLYREEQRRAKELATLNAISATVGRSLELEEILNAALDKTSETLTIEPRGGIFLLDPESGELVLKVHRNLPPSFVEQERRIAVGDCLCGLVAETGQILFCADPHDTRHSRSKLLDCSTHLIVPLKAKERVLGVMFIYPRSPHEPSAQDLQLLTSIGSQIGVAIENAHLYENMRFYVRQITKAQEDERRRVARELHDETTQALVALARQIDALTASSAPLPEATLERIEKIRELTDYTLQGLRRCTQDLRPPTLDDLGLLATLKGLVTDLAKTEAVEAELEVIGDQRRLSPEAELLLFRIAQEALNNVRRHARASKVVTTVEFEDERVRLTISDNGQGFEVPQRTSDLAAAGKLGLMGMHERARLLGGALTIKSELGKGTTIVADVPAETPAD